MKTIRCHFTKACRIFAIFTESLDKNMGILPKKIKEISLEIEELYARLYHWYMFEALSLLVYLRDPHSRGYSSLNKLYFSLGFAPV